MIVRTGDADLFCSARGEGPTCLVLCNIGTTPYERQMPTALGDRLRLVFVDLRGSGRSTGNPSDLTFDRLATDLDAVRVHLGLERVIVFGHSVLSMLAIEYSRRCPETVSHVITAGAPPFGNMARIASEASAFFDADASESRKQALRDNLARLPADALPAARLFAETPKRFFDPNTDAPSLFEGAIVKSGFLVHVFGVLAPGWDVTREARSLSVPMLLTHGRCDYVVPYTLWEATVPALPRATFRRFEKSGHQPFVEEPDVFTSVVTEWLGRTFAPA